MGEGRGKDRGLFQPFELGTEFTAPRPGAVAEEEGNSLGSILGGDDDEVAAEDWA
jgi:hypothetical protein